MVARRYGTNPIPARPLLGAPATLVQSDTLDQNKLEIEKLKAYIERSDQVILDQCEELKQQRLRIKAFDRSKTFIQNVEALAPSTGRSGLGYSGPRRAKYQPKRKVLFVSSSGEEIDDSQTESNEPQTEEMTYQSKHQSKGKAKVASSPRDIPESSKNAELRGNYARQPKAKSVKDGLELKSKKELKRLYSSDPRRLGFHS